MRIGFLGPPGTFTEEALLSQPDWAQAELVPLSSQGEVMEATEAGEVGLGFVPLENSIEGTVNESMDALIFDTDLLIQREVVLDVRLHLLAPPGTSLTEVRKVVSYPHAAAQCRRFLRAQLPGASLVASNSTADAARQLGESPEPGTAALAPALAAKLYGLELLARDVEDHHNNQTRFVAVARQGVPAPTGHDRTSIVCFQDQDRPGSLHAILGQFAARNINLTKLESRPTKRALGDYCFIIDMEGHLADEIVADCLRDLHAQLAGVKFLGSYPAAGDHGPGIRREAEARWRAADEWLGSLRSQIGQVP
ncbi:MAG TPA: prephenate dehydratase [Acidimicrobiales bacterium]|nr:prephenate dehydratase [Acidimicrobiales bacterium]